MVFSKGEEKKEVLLIARWGHFSFCRPKYSISTENFDPNIEHTRNKETKKNQQNSNENREQICCQHMHRAICAFILKQIFIEC